MRNSKSVFAMGFVLLTTCIPVHAQGLLGLGSGSAGNDNLIDIGIGGDDGNVLDVNVGGGSLFGGGGSDSSSIASVSVGSGSSGGGGGLGVNANVLGGTATADVNLGGGGLGANVNVLGGGTGGGLDININVRNPDINIPGIPGVPGVPGVPQPGVLNAAVNGQAGFAVGGFTGTPAPGCGADVSNQVSGLIDGTSVDSSWQSASGVQVQRVEMCSAMREWVSNHLREHGHASILRPAVQADSLISASLARSPYGSEHVFAVKKQGSKLIVYVY